MNPYKVLQVDPDAEREVIEAAYKRLALKYHPDKDSSASATARMVEINAAYEVLKDPERRAQYDRERLRAERARREADQQKSPTGGPKFPIEEVWFVRRNPGAVGKTARTGWSLLVRGFGLAVAIGVSIWVRDLMNEHRAEEEAKAELQKLNVRDSMESETGKFIARCVWAASPKLPGLASAYCSCLAQDLQSRFDYAPIMATSVSEYTEQFSSRFEAAMPEKATQVFCFNRVQPRVIPMPAAVPARPPGVRKSGAPPAFFALHGTDPFMQTRW